jgi:UTP--glucose-1-phosphate uridylyltransferase
MYTIDTAVFPIAGLGTRFLPATKSIPKEMLPVLDKPLIQYAVEEAKAAGIKKFIFITSKDKEAIENHFDRYLFLEDFLEKRGKDKELELIKDCHLETGEAIFIRQQEPLGLGHAILCARHFVGDRPFGVILADDLIVSDQPCLGQMIDHYRGGNMVALMNVDQQDTQKYGIIQPQLIEGKMVRASGVVEKPHPNDAPSTMAVVGRYILDPSIFYDLLHKEKGVGGEIQLTDSLERTLSHCHLHGYFFDGERFDCGTKEGWFLANMHMAIEQGIYKVNT